MNAGIAALESQLKNNGRRILIQRPEVTSVLAK